MFEFRVPPCPPFAQGCGVLAYYLTQTLGQALLGKQAIAPNQGMKKISSLCPATGRAETVNLGLLVQSSGGGALGQLFFNAGSAGEPLGGGFCLALRTQQLSGQLEFRLALLIIDESHIQPASVNA